MKFSIIIATFGRKSELKKLFESFLIQSHTNFELIVVDQNENLIDSLISEYQLKLNVIHIKTSIKGLSRARNLGLKIASGDIIAFADDDCVYRKDTIFKVNEIFSNNNIDVLSIKILEKNTLKNVGINWPIKKDEITKLNIFKVAMSASLFLKFTKVSDITFDEDFGIGSKYGSAEESDYLLRILEKENIKTLYTPDIYIYHPLHQNIFSCRRDFNYAVGLGAFYRKHNKKITFNTLFNKIIIRPLGGMVINFYNKKSITYFLTFIGRVYGYITYK